ncbi:hypothetical protein JB92DRAFT_2835626 [Gautieria morchelliformis]|nr:hypothetical protein JB92DRAFT_2835626 [Gautieria morchelliformis]
MSRKISLSHWLCGYKVSEVTTTSHAAGAQQQKARSNSRVVDLKSECKSKGLPMGGKKANLVLWLREHEAVEGRKMQIDIVNEEGHAIDEADDAELDYLIVNSTVQKEAGELGQSFLSVRMRTMVTAIKMDCVTASKVADTFAWVDKYIIECRRDSARKTKTSVLSLWKRWLGHQLAAGVLPDDIIDAHRMIEYLKYAATRKMFAPNGKTLASTQRLLASSLKKIMVMLGHVHRRQEETPTNGNARDDDLDVAKDMILDYSLFPEQFQEIECAIFCLNQNYLTPDGQRSGTGKWHFGVLSLYYEMPPREASRLGLDSSINMEKGIHD